MNFGDLMSQMTITPAGRGAPPDGSFATVRRGYDPEQVDRRVRQLVGEVDAERRRAEAAADELAQVRARGEQTAYATRDGFGSRVEEVLRRADAEAAESRRRAGQESTATVERARADAEAHRHQVEQELIERASKVDDDASRRTATLNHREQQVDEHRAEAEAEAERIRAGARREAEAEGARGEQRARELTEAAERAARHDRDTAVDGLGEVTEIRDRVRAQIAQLHRQLETELASDDSFPGGASGGTRDDGRADVGLDEDAPSTGSASSPER